MVQENILAQQANFCIAPLLGTFATVDTTTTTARLLIKNSTGVTTVSYTFNPNIAQNTEIYYLDYIGPRDLSALQSGMIFFTMESNLTSSVSIKKWNLDKDNTRLNLDYTITKASSGYETISSRAMAVGRYYTNLSLTTVTGTGSIVLDNVDNVVSGTRLYVGPSSNTSYLGNYEEVTATSISGTTVYITSNTGTPLHSYFNIGDPVTYLGNIYLFSDVGHGVDTSRGEMFVLDNYTGETLATHNSALYNAVKTSNYGLPYYNSVAIVKGSELIYIDITDFSIMKSSRMNVTKINSNTVLDVKAIAFTLSDIYRLQKSKMMRSDTGAFSEITWTTYNYHADSSYRYSDCVVLYAERRRLGNEQSTTIYARVIDQYGMGISNKTVHFNKEYGDTGGTWSDVNKEATTDINGVGTIVYTSAWYNSSLASIINEDIKITAYTDGANILTGSIYVWASMIIYLDAKYVLDNPNVTGLGVPAIVQKIDSKSSTVITKQLASFLSTFILKSLSKLKMPGGQEYYQDLAIVAIIKQLKNFEGDCFLTQRKLLTGASGLKQLTTHIGSTALSQTYISRHLPAGSNKDNVFIAQFRFLIDAVPVPFSNKNNVNSTIWLRLAPYGFDLNKSTLVFKVREFSYAGDTEFIDYSLSPLLVVTEFDAGGGLLGLDVLFTPPEYFHNDAIVYVYLSVYDNAIPANKIEFDYWFSVIPDYKAPFITNESPSRDAENVPVDTDIVFDILDSEVGVDITSLDLYINNRIKQFTYEVITNGYRVTYTNTTTYYYKQTIEIAVQVNDSSGQANVLYDMWKFEIIDSVAPIVDVDNFYPPVCVRGFKTRTTHVNFNIYDGGNGLDVDSIELLVDNISREYNVTPIIKRIF